ncbi:MAG: hypothetical protein D6729_01685 [Deltaproteobacteria bacterium]|nr:MAG: hypothetical protein D6729_01685 [Deltaproteobacteria bacterium]
MATLFAAESARGRLEVRSAGRTLRLYVDGVLHSAFNPARGITGSVWDALALAPWLAPSPPCRSVLLLGLGGGAAVQLIRRHLRSETMTAVEIDPLAIEVARRFFGVGGRDVEIVRADARRWLARCRRRFDLVIDDLFVEAGRIPARASGTSEPDWWRRLAARVRRGGMLVANFADAAALTRSGLLEDAATGRFSSRARITFRDYENVVVVLSEQPLSRRLLEARLCKADLRAADRRRLQMCVRTRL